MTLEKKWHVKLFHCFFKAVQSHFYKVHTAIVHGILSFCSFIAQTILSFSILLAGQFEHESFLIWHPSFPSRKLIYLWYFWFANPEEEHALPAWNPAFHVRASCMTCCVVWKKKKRLQALPINFSITNESLIIVLPTTQKLPLKTIL